MFSSNEDEEDDVMPFIYAERVKQKERWWKRDERKGKEGIFSPAGKNVKVKEISS